MGRILSIRGELGLKTRSFYGQFYVEPGPLQNGQNPGGMGCQPQNGQKWGFFGLSKFTKLTLTIYKDSNFDFKAF